MALDPVIHQETRLRLMALLASLGEGAQVEFTWLKEALDLTEGNLSSHLAKLEEAGYVQVEKGYQGRRPGPGFASPPGAGGLPGPPPGPVGAPQGRLSAPPWPGRGI